MSEQQRNRPDGPISEFSDAMEIGRYGSVRNVMNLTLLNGEKATVPTIYGAAC
jgi:hypothetical protein